MTEKLIRDVAELWISRGGDAEGITWTWGAIRDECRKIEIENLEQEP